MIRQFSVSNLKLEYPNFWLLWAAFEETKLFQAADKIKSKQIKSKVVVEKQCL